MSRRDFFQIFVCFIFNVSLGSAPNRKNFDIQRNTRVGSGGQFTSNRLSNDHMYMYFILYTLTCLTRVFKQNSYLLACIIVGDFPNSRYLTYRFLLFGPQITFCSDNNCFLLLRQNYQLWNKEAPQCT